MAIGWRWSSLSLNQKLALGALVLGVLALFARPNRGNVVTLDVKELATIIDKEGDHVTASELAGWIVAGRSDYRLIDLRSEKEYGEYHIPTAENVTLTALPDSSLLANEKAVLYSEGGIHASQAWMLLRAKGLRLRKRKRKAASPPGSATRPCDLAARRVKASVLWTILRMTTMTARGRET